MSEAGGGNLGASIEKLIDQMEKMYDRQAMERERTDNLLALLGRLSEILARMEDSRVHEAEMTKRIEMLNKSLERVADINEKLAGGEGGPEKTMDRVINGVKVFGMILSTLANSVQLTVDNVNMVLNRGSDVSGNNQATRTQTDLASILQPVSILVKNLVDERMKQDTSSREEVPDVGGSPE